jgi:hypothetical protein
MTLTGLTWAAWLAVDESKVTPGLLGFVVVALLGVATFLLIRSMNRQLRRIDLPDDVRDPEAPAAPDETVAEGEQRDSQTP